MFVYKIQANPIHTVLKYGIYYDLWIGNGEVLKRNLKINNSWTELFNFQNLFNCH